MLWDIAGFLLKSCKISIRWPESCDMTLLGKGLINTEGRGPSKCYTPVIQIVNDRDIGKSFDAIKSYQCRNHIDALNECIMYSVKMYWLLFHLTLWQSLTLRVYGSSPTMHLLTFPKDISA